MLTLPFLSTFADLDDRSATNSEKKQSEEKSVDVGDEKADLEDEGYETTKSFARPVRFGHLPR